MAQVEPAKPRDVDQVRRISQTVFVEYTAYAKLLPRFFSTPGVSTYIARVNKQIVGFIMLGFIPWSGSDHDQEAWIADILSIAVVPERQRQGIGGTLLLRAFELTAQMGEWRNLRQIQLTCPESNDAALDFFAKQGFRVCDANHGCFAGGQKAWRLSRPIPTPK
jgi:ribosomal protein S18 acetylase RimI-like enzyme